MRDVRLTLCILGGKELRSHQATTVEHQETEFGFDALEPEGHRELSRCTCTEQTAGVYGSLVDHRDPIRLDLNREQHPFCEGVPWTPCNALVR